VIGTQQRWQEELFVAGPLSSLVPDDHILRLVDKVLYLSWLRDEVKDLYCCDNGRPGIDPEAAVRLMLVGIFQGIVHDRKLMREAHGIVIDVDVTTGEQSEGSQLPDQIERIESNTGKKVKTLSADSGYAHGKNFRLLEEKDIGVIIPPQKENSKPRRLPLRRFKYDSKNMVRVALCAVA
jgi:hypothetical protein